MEEYTHTPISGILAAMFAVLAEFYAHLGQWLLLGAVLCFCDLRYGILAARKRGEAIRTSRMWRRTVNKMVDYLCWVTIAEVCSRTFAPALGVPLISFSVLFAIYGIELSSCVNNYFEYKGVKRRFNVWSWFGRHTDALAAFEEHKEEAAPEEEAEIENE